ncbi:MAG: hypothetical protein IH995_04865 [Proteobacteria bacterium]|nr:hypothetical protein [Pseudomonadota bacterium]
MTKQEKIEVLYKEVDGAHFFTSITPAAKGLLVAHKNLQTAFEAVALQLEEVISYNLGEDVECEAGMSFDEFSDYVLASKECVPEAVNLQLATIANWALEGNLNVLQH